MLYNKIYKNYQVSVSNPYKVQTIKKTKDEDVDEKIIINAEEEKKAIIAAGQLRADNILNKARHDAQQMLYESENKIQQHVAEVEAFAKQKGYEDGEKQAKEQYETIIKEAESIKENAILEYEETMKSIEPEIVNIILELAKKVITEEMKTKPEHILSIVKDTLWQSSSRERVVIKVSKTDYEIVENEIDNIIKSVDGVKEIEIVKDSSLEDGSCYIETDFGSVDGSLNARYKLVEDEILKLLNKN